MTEVSKRLIGVKKASLEGLGEEWGSESYVLYAPATYDDKLKVQHLDIHTMTPEQQVEYQTGVVKEHFVAGRAKAYQGGQFVEVDLVADDILSVTTLCDYLYGMIMGVDVDPKALGAQVQDKSESSPSETPSETALLES